MSLLSSQVGIEIQGQQPAIFLGLRDFSTTTRHRMFIPHVYGSAIVQWVDLRIFCGFRVYLSQGRWPLRDQFRQPPWIL